MHNKTSRSLLALLLGVFGTLACAADKTPPPDQVIVPEVDRRDVRTPRYPSNDFELGTFVGSYATQNFGTSMVYGIRLGYHITEDVFVESAVAQTQVSDELFRQILPGGVFTTATQTLSYANVAVGYNVLPGEVFFGKNVAKASGLYLIGGVGTTRLAEQRRQTINFGTGLRVLFKDWFALQLDVRDHMFSLDLLGKRESTHNLEATAGLAFYF